MTKRAQWEEQNEFGSELGIKILLLVLRFFGRYPFYLLLAPVVLFIFVFNTPARRASVAYWHRMRPEQSTLKNYACCVKHFWNFALSLVDRLQIAANEFDFSKLIIHGQEELHEDLNSGRGVVVLGSHLGTMDACKAVGENADYGVTAIVHTLNAVKFNRQLQAITEQTRTNFIQVENFGIDTAIELSERITKGELIAIAGDRQAHKSGRGTAVEFLGDPATFPDGPFILASLLKAPVYYIFCYRTSKGVEIYVEKVGDQLKFSRKTRASDIRQTIESYADRLAFHTKRAPYQWFNFFNFWSS